MRFSLPTFEQIKAKYRTWGVPEVDGQAVYTGKGREAYHQKGESVS